MSTAMSRAIVSIAVPDLRVVTNTSLIFPMSSSP
jgi:hypothetical protein